MRRGADILTMSASKAAHELAGTTGHLLDRVQPVIQISCLEVMRNSRMLGPSTVMEMRMGLRELADGHLEGC